MKIIKTENSSRNVEVFKQGISKAGNSFKSNMKRNIVILGALVLICGAVFLNIKLFANPKDTKDYDPTFYNSSENDSAKTSSNSSDDSYFAMAQLDRAQARDQALEVLYSITSNENATDESKSNAFNEIEKMADVIEMESNIETLVKSKGFAECITVINDGAANVVVSSEGLMPSQIAQITEIIYEQAGISPSDIKIIEKN